MATTKPTYVDENGNVYTMLGNIRGPAGKDGINGKSIYANTVDPWSVSGWNPAVAGDLFLNTTTGILWSAKAGAVTSNVQSNWTKVGELAGKITVDSALSSTSTNPVQNKVINDALGKKANVSHSHSSLTNSSGRVFNVPTGGSGGEQKTLVITDDLNAYQPAGNYASSAHKHPISDINNLQSTIDGIYTDMGLQDEAIAGKADSVHTHEISNINGLQSALNGKSNLDHNHDSVYQAKGDYATNDTLKSYVTGTTFINYTTYIEGEVNKKANVSHDHDISDINGLQSALDGKSGTGHTHSEYVTGTDFNAYTSWIEGEVSGKAASNHTHTIANVSGLQSALDGKSGTSHAHNYLPLSGGSLGGIVRGGAIDVHPENGGTIIGYYTNDLAFMLKRGGSCVAKNVTQSTSISVNENWFDASPSYGSFTVTAVTDVVQIIIKSPVQYSWGTSGGIGFGAAAWRAKSVKFELGYSPTNTGSASNPDSDIVWVTKINVTNNSQGLVYTNNFTGPSVSEGGTSSTTWSYIRITLTDWNNTTPRIAQIFSVNFGSAGMHNAFLSRSGGSVYGTITPYANNSYYLGSSTNKWAGVYATTFNENGTTLADKYAAKSHTHSEYVTGTDFSAYTNWIEGEVNGKSDTGHTHSISNVSGLQSALDGKSGTGHTHTSLNTAFVFNNRDMPQEATNLSATTTAHTINFYRNALSIPYQMDNANDGGILRCRGNSESNVIFELATWDDSGNGETIQFNYYPTTSQVTPTYSVSVPKKTGTIALTSDIPTSLPASDVYSWAKASTKPTYTASEVGAASSGHTHDGRYIRWNGSAADVNSMGWGTLTAANGYTILSHCSSSDGGDWGMVNKGGQIFMQLDGYYYQNEGRYRVLDTSNISMSFSNGVLTITYNS